MSHKKKPRKTNKQKRQKSKSRSTNIDPNKKTNHAGQKMYTSMSIEGFRLFKKIDIENISKINLFFGGNNSGKTSILEAIYTHSCGLNFTPFQNNVIFRRRNRRYSSGLEIGDSFMSLFNELENPLKFKISAKVEGDNKHHNLTCSFYPSPDLRDLDPIGFGESPDGYSHFPIEQTNEIQMVGGKLTVNQMPSYPIGEWCAEMNGKKIKNNIQYPNPNITSAKPFRTTNIHDILAHRNPDSATKIFSYLKRYNLLSDFISEIEKAFPSIKDIDMIPYPDGQTSGIYVTSPNNRKLPISVLGDGSRRWFHIVGHMLVNRNACHLIEEIDSTFHPASHKYLSKMLFEYAKKFENQLFLTSHSIEFADAFLNTLYGEDGIINLEEDDPVRVFTLKNEPDSELEIWCLSGREAYEQRTHYKLEIR